VKAINTHSLYYVCACLVATCGFLFSAASAEPVLVHFAGFSIAGQASRSGQDFPYSFKLMDGATARSFNAALLAAARAQNLPNLTISTDLGNVQAGDSLALAVVLTWENVGIERLGGLSKIAVNLQAELLLFDYTSKQIVATYPFGVERIDAVRGEISTSQIEQNFTTLYDPGSGLFLKEFATALRRISAKRSFGTRVQIVSSAIAPAAAATLTGSNIDDRRASELLISAFERYLSKNSNIPVLPHASDQVIGGAMALRFANGDVFNLKLPPPDYRIHLTLTNARKVQVSETDAASAWAYASYLDVWVEQPLSGQNILAASFKYPFVRVMAKGSEPDDTAAFEESLLTISDQITQNFNAPAKDWNRQWLVDGDPGQIMRMPVFLAHCR
jgi:hypothetical protein